MLEQRISRTSTFSGRALLLWLLLFALLIAFRLPNAWPAGRFLDEEATVFLAYAWHFPWVDALLRPFAGYWNLAANGTTLAVAKAVQGGLLPLELAPYVTMLTGLAAQLLVGALILTGQADWLRTRSVRLAALAIVAIAPATEEVLLNVMHVQFHLALSVALILVLDVPRSLGARIFYAVPLLLGPLCGPGAIAFLPLFALRALLERDRDRAEQLVLLGLASATQLLLFYGGSPMRGGLPDLATAGAAVFQRLVALPLAGIYPADLLGKELATGRHPILSVALGAIACAFIVLMVVRSVIRDDQSRWLFLGAAIIAVAALGGGIAASQPSDLLRPYISPRYNYLPTVLLCWGFIAAAAGSGARSERLALAALAGIMLMIGLLHYARPSPRYASGPEWTAEVRAWRLNPKHPLKVWPLPFAADLSGKARPCPPARPPGDSSAPRYCEAGWMAEFYRR